MYRDDAEAAQLRIRSLEAKLAERDAGLAARDAEVAELQQQIMRFEGRVPKTPRPRVWPLLLCLGTGALGLAAGLQVSHAPPVPYPHESLTGVPACDLYVERYEACIASTLPPSSRTAMKDTLASTRQGFQQAAQTSAGRNALRTACGQMLDTLATSGVCKPK